MKYPPRIDPKKESAKITAFLKKAFKEAGKTQAVIAASGGVDSSTSLLLTARALGPGNLHVLHLPARATDPVHLEHLRLVLKTAQIPDSRLLLIPVSTIIQKTWRIINRYTAEEVRPYNAKRLDLSVHRSHEGESVKFSKQTSTPLTPITEARVTNSRRLQGPGLEPGEP